MPENLKLTHPLDMKDEYMQAVIAEYAPLYFPQPDPVFRVIPKYRSSFLKIRLCEAGRPLLDDVDLADMITGV